MILFTSYGDSHLKIISFLFHLKEQEILQHRYANAYRWAVCHKSVIQAFDGEKSADKFTTGAVCKYI